MAKRKKKDLRGSPTKIFPSASQQFEAGKELINTIMDKSPGAGRVFAHVRHDDTAYALIGTDDPPHQPGITFMGKKVYYQAMFHIGDSKCAIYSYLPEDKDHMLVQLNDMMNKGKKNGPKKN